MTTLVVAAHPDDEVLGCGGTIARLTDEGEEVHIAILCKTRASGYAESAIAHLATAGHRIELHEYNQPDQKLDAQPLRKIVRKLERLITEIRPDTIFTHHCGDLNLDHEITHRAVLTATRPVGDCPVRKVYAFETPSSTEWAFDTPAFAPNVFIGINTARKIRAMQLYESEARPFPHPRSPEALNALAEWRGAQSGLRAAEAFQLIRAIRS